MIVSTTPYVILDKKKILPRRMSTTACSFASHFGQELGSECRFAKISRGRHPRIPALC